MKDIHQMKAYILITIKNILTKNMSQAILDSGFANLTINIIVKIKESKIIKLEVIIPAISDKSSLIDMF